MLSGEADLIVNIVDASNLERNLYLTTQLLEMRVPMVVALNMIDIARDAAHRASMSPALAARLGCPVVPLVATRGEGVDELQGEIDRRGGAAPRCRRSISPTGRRSRTRSRTLLPAHRRRRAAERRSIRAGSALKLLEGDEACAGDRAGRPAAEAEAAPARGVERPPTRTADILIADARYGFANQLIREAVRARRRGRADASPTASTGSCCTGCSGIPIFLVVMYLMFLFTINFGSAFIDFFDQFAGALLVDGFGAAAAPAGQPRVADHRCWPTASAAASRWSPPSSRSSAASICSCRSWRTPATWRAPPSSWTGSCARVGLPGKSFIPLIVGFGCNVPAIMATRTLENRRDRIMTVMMAPFMSCGARLPVYALFAAAFFPSGGQNLVFALYLIGIVFAVLTGLVLKTHPAQGRDHALRHGAAALSPADAQGRAAPHLGSAEGVHLPRRPGHRRRGRRPAASSTRSAPTAASATRTATTRCWPPSARR